MTMSNRLIVLAAASLLPLSVQAADMPAKDDPIATCQEIGGRYTAAIGSQDATRVAVLFTSDGVLNGPEGVFIGTHAITDVMAGGVKAGVIKHEDTYDGARRVGDVILCYGAWKATFRPESPMKEVGGRFDKVLESSNGDWRIALLTYSYSPPPH
jgi:ketosteroid isomerase-like protein